MAKRKSTRGRRRNAHGQFVKAGGTTRRRRRRLSASRRPRVRAVRMRRKQALVITNPRRRRRSYGVTRRRRHYRRNPGLSLRGFGFDKPTLRAVGFTVLGVAGAPFIEGFANQFIPASITSNKFGNYAVKIASALGLSFAAKKVFGAEAGKMVFVGAGAMIAVSALRDFVPGVFGGALPSAAGTGAQPMLGEYPQVPMRGMGSYITDGIPDRLRPESRF